MDAGVGVGVRVCGVVGVRGVGVAADVDVGVVFFVEKYIFKKFILLFYLCIIWKSSKSTVPKLLAAHSF